MPSNSSLDGGKPNSVEDASFESTNGDRLEARGPAPNRFARPAVPHRAARGAGIDPRAMPAGGTGVIALIECGVKTFEHPPS
jgi:hypothetical protein